MENDIAVWRYLHSLKAYPAVQICFHILITFDCHMGISLKA